MELSVFNRLAGGIYGLSYPQDLSQAISEAPLPKEEKQLMHRLTAMDPPDLPEIPECGFEESSFQAAAYLSVRNEETCFLFLDNGDVILFENNGGWQYRKTPLLSNCFAENAIMESDHSCLVLNLDHGIDRITYHRIETREDLYELPLFAP